MVVVDQYNYGCNLAKDRGTCSSTIRVPREAAERCILAGVKADLLREAAFPGLPVVRYCSASPGLAGRQRPESAPRRGEARPRQCHAGHPHRHHHSEHEGRVAKPPSARSSTCRRTSTRRSATSRPRSRSCRAREVSQRAVANLEQHVRNIPVARESLHELIGDQIVVTRNENGDLIAEIAASSTASASQINVVAGAGFEPATFGL